MLPSAKDLPEDSKALETLATISFVLMILALWSHKLAWVKISIALLAIALFWKALAKKLAWAWMKFAEILGAINSRVILGVVFFLVLSPLGFLYRLSRGDFLGLKRPRPGESHWLSREHLYSAKDMENVW